MRTGCKYFYIMGHPKLRAAAKRWMDKHPQEGSPLDSTPLYSSDTSGWIKSPGWLYMVGLKSILL